jgi:hypothetical protein
VLKSNRCVAHLIALMAIWGAAQPLYAAAKKPAAAPAPVVNGRRVIALAPVRNVRIEMPDESFHDFGEDFQARLTTLLTQGGRYIVADDPQLVRSEVSALESSRMPPPDYTWSGSLVPAATVRIKVEAMSFQTGSRGERMFYGFNEHFRTPFNDGYSSSPNEFPLRSNQTSFNWFDSSFNRRGIEPFDSRSGLDLGDGVSINALFAYLSVKYALYHSELRLRVDIDAPLAGRHEFRTVSVKGEGYFFDIAGAYAGYSAGIRVARRDAMDQALKNAISGAYSALDRAFADLPLTARVDAVLPDGTVLLGTGPMAEVKAGVRYELATDASVLIEVASSSKSGSMGRVVQGNAAAVQAGVLVRESLGGLPPAIQPFNPSFGPVRSLAAGLSNSSLLAPLSLADGIPAAIESINLPWKDIPQTDLTGLAPQISWWTAFIRSLGEAVFLPYRLWRYFNYDLAYHSGVAESEASDRSEWSTRARNAQWAAQIGLNHAPEMSAENLPVVAILDSGVDYNHWTLHAHLWLNPTPSDVIGDSGPAGLRDLYGWDFISGDPHPYDDGYHGTEIASVVSAVAPRARLMALKVFNPWGITSSAALYGAFQYAVDHGAKIIVCGWATQLDSKAIEQGVSYAHDHGVLVVASAGDLGLMLSKQPSSPAALSGTYDNVLTVASVASDDGYVWSNGRYTGYDAALVGIAAPGQGIEAASPRGGMVNDTSSGLAAAMVAGAAARLISAEPAGTPAEWIARLRSEADPVVKISGGVKGGLRLRVKH